MLLGGRKKKSSSQTAAILKEVTAERPDGWFDYKAFDQQEAEEIDERTGAEAPTAAPAKVLETKRDYFEAFFAVMELQQNYLDPNNPIELKSGQEYFLISTHWADHLKQDLQEFTSEYLDELKQRDAVVESKPGWTPAKGDFWRPIDNSDLVESAMTWGCMLREGLIEIDQYFLVDSEAWKQFTDLFGGGPEICREAIEQSGRVMVEVRSLNLYVVASNDLTKYRRAQFSKHTKIGDFRDEMCRRFGLDPEKVRLFDFYSGKLYAYLDNMEDSLTDRDIANEQFVLIEIMRGDETWQIDVDKVPETTSVGYRASTLGRNRPMEPGLVGLYNLRNTCYMDSTLQCLSNIPQLRSFFVSDDYLNDLNEDNPLGTNGKLAHAFADLMKRLWLVEGQRGRAISPDDFKEVLDDVHPDFAGYMQHDSQELLSYLLDDLHEDVNRIQKKEMTEPVEPCGRPDAAVAKEALEVYKKRNDSLVADLCVGMLLSKVACPRAGCGHVSTTFDPYMMIPLPVEAGPEKLRKLEVTVVLKDNPLRRSVKQIEVPSSGYSIYIRNAVAKSMGVPAPNLLLAELADHKIIRVLADSMTIESIGTDTQVYAIENPRSKDHLDMLHGDFTHWFRPLLDKTAGKISVDENYLDHDEDEVEEDQNDKGMDFIDVGDEKDGGTTISILTYAQMSGKPVIKDSSPPTGVVECPFKVGQTWRGHLEPKSYVNSKFSVRVEVVSVDLEENNVYQVSMLFDMNRHIPQTRDSVEQETYLLVGLYNPKTVSRKRRGEGRRQPVSPASASSSAEKTAKKKKGGASAKPRAGVGKVKKRTSSTRFSPKGVATRMFGGLSGRRKSTSRAAATSNAAGDPEVKKIPSASDDDSSITISSHESGEQKVAGERELLKGEATNEEQQEEDPKEMFTLGEVELEAGSWKALFSSYDEPTQVKKTDDFKCLGYVDEQGLAFFGKIIFDGGYGGAGAMDFILRLSPPEQQAQVDASEKAGGPALLQVERKLGLNDTRAVRFVSKTDSRRLTASNPYSNGEFCLDPGVFIVSKDITEGELYDVVVEYFLSLYNVFMEYAFKEKPDGYPLEELSKLPEKIDRAQLDDMVDVLFAGKNYTLDPSSKEPKSGSRLSSESKEIFFSTRHSFLRVLCEWEPDCPVMDLFCLMEQYMEENLRKAVEVEKNLTVYDCMDLFCKSETLGEKDLWFCSNCKTHTVATKTLQIWCYPRVLVLHLKRFSQESDGYYSDKLLNEIDFPLEDLDLRRYPLEAESKENAIYDLCCVSSHYGGLGSGHYTAYCRNENDGKWYEFDDESVMVVRHLSTICSRAAYVLFYLRKDLRPKAWEPIPEDEVQV